jgi:hypothetical protein
MTTGFFLTKAVAPARHGDAVDRIAAFKAASSSVKET